ncbi:hypothetical protein BG842_12355 [Haladaptatus sp. W1]|uniref:DUF7344 domain-containing protein n=1 Tax=Haladaptatus sp. W1 TaxID=1897478 RepID=UPI000849B06E|nr:hypothetical protein [Haladaptatus sp. W1]ODR79509.1 hypothetical protein BG842_12355 [Haladaptatus sp. W1]
MGDNTPDDTETASEKLSDAELPELSEDVLELNHVFQALAESRRRYLVYTLKSKTQWELTDIATKIASWEMDLPEHEVPGGEVERTYVSLYHAHVPKLVDEGVITFEKSTEVIRPGPNAQQVLAALAGAGASLDMQQESHARSEMDDANK